MVYETVMQYACPMLLHSYALLPREEQEEIKGALKQSFGSEEVVRNQVEREFRGRYRLYFVPETVFQMATILQMAELIIRWNQGDGKAEELMKSFYVIGNRDILESSLVEHLPFDKVSRAERFSKEERPKFVSQFMLRTYGKLNFSPDIRTMYLYVCNLISQRFAPELQELEIVKTNPKRHVQEEHRLIRKVVTTLMEDYRKLADILDIALYDLNYRTDDMWYEWSDWNHHGVPWPYPGVGRNTANILLNPCHLSVLREAALSEYEAARDGSILLWRGEAGVSVFLPATTMQKDTRGSAHSVSSSTGPESSSSSSAAAPVLQGRIFGGGSYSLHGRVQQFNREQGYRNLANLNLITTVTGLTFSVPSDVNMEELYSASYGNTLLGGSFREARTKGGARVLDFYYDERTWGVSCLKFSLLQILNDPNGFPFRVSTLNVVSQLIPEKGEFWHSRSLFRYDPNKWIRGLRPSDASDAVLAVDASTGLGFFCSSNEDVDYDFNWAASHFLAKIMVNPAIRDRGQLPPRQFYSETVLDAKDRDNATARERLDSLVMRLNFPGREWNPFLDLARQIPQSSGALVSLDERFYSPTEVLFVGKGERQRVLQAAWERATSLIMYQSVYAQIMTELAQKVPRYEGE